MGMYSWEATKKDLLQLENVLRNKFYSYVGGGLCFSGIEGINKDSSETWEYNTRSVGGLAVQFKDIDLGRNSGYGSEAETTLDLDVQFKAKSTQEEHKLSDMIVEMGMAAYIECSVLEEENNDFIIKKYIHHFHLDRDHETENKDNSLEEESEFMHPLYHFQFGGMGLDKNHDTKRDFGDLLRINTPRIAHHPMDLVLAIDFVVRNFYKKKVYSKLVEDPQYMRILQDAQERYLKPYALSMASRWVQDFSIRNTKDKRKQFTCDTNIEVNYPYSNIMPYII